MTSTVTSPTWTATGYIFCIYCTLYIVYLSKDGYDKAYRDVAADYYGECTSDETAADETAESDEESSESDSESDSDSDSWEESVCSSPSL